jgi:hypothetical protein
LTLHLCRHARIVSGTLHIAVCNQPGDEGGVGEEPLGVVLAMTTIMYACCAAARTTQSAETDFSWVAFAVFAGIVVFWGSVGWHAVKEMRKREPTDQGLPSISPQAWGEPDLAQPSTSPEAQAEVAELEAMWRQSRRRRRATSE